LFPSVGRVARLDENLQDAAARPAVDSYDPTTLGGEANPLRRESMILVEDSPVVDGKRFDLEPPDRADDACYMTAAFLGGAKTTGNCDSPNTLFRAVKSASSSDCNLRSCSPTFPEKSANISSCCFVGA
jgi:hypothetical protein